MKFIQHSGLALFILGFTLFLVSFFLPGYQLTPSIIRTQIADEQKQTVFIDFSSAIVGNPYSGNFALITDLGDAFERINQAMIDRYGLSAQDIETIHRINRTTGQFTLASLDQAFDAITPADLFKKKAFADYGSWMDGREYSSEDELKNHITDVAESIRK